jgi:hypothetical protein
MDAITVNLNNSSFVIEEPTIGQIMEIESLKLAYTVNNYSYMSQVPMKLANLNLDIVDSVATFQVLIPKLKELYNVDNITKLKAAQARELIHQYKNVFFPWFKKVQEQLDVPYEEDQKDQPEKNG